ncbi:uncharacterized protein LOC110355492 isoform X6 [Columba livia]|uniref:uncharacterized protein LOC110355492 isoform X6 n=1 Tax=Columba livia TaxID=8932 RepID=UPI0031BAC743
MDKPGHGALNRPLDMSQRSCSRKCAEHPLGPAFHSSGPAYGSDSVLLCAGQLSRTEIPRTPHPVPIPARTAQDQPRCSRPGPEHSDGLLQGPGADGEDVTSSASPELMFSMDFDTEWEKEQLLKDEAAGSPKAELSSWNRLFNVNRLRGSSHKYGAPGRLMEPESKEQPLSDAANPSAAALGERFSEDGARETHWLPWEKLGMVGSRRSRNPWRRLRSSSLEQWGAAPEGSPRSPPGSAPPLRSPRWPQPGSGLARRAPQLHLLPLHSPTCPFEHTMFPFLLSPFLFLGKDPWVSRPCLAQPAFGLHFILFFRLRT